MGMWDTMQQGGNKVLSAVGGMGQMPNSQGQGFAQQKPPTPSGNGKMQMVGDMNLQPKPMPAMGAGFGQQKPVGNYGMMGGKRPNQLAGVGAGIMNAYQAAKQKRPIMGGGLAPSMGQESPAQSYGQPDMVRPDQPQSGIANLQSPLDMQRQQEQLQTQQQAAMSPMQQAAEQMRGYEGPDLGSQDPRELARVSGGIGPSNPMQAMQQMDENGMEARRGAR